MATLPQIKKVTDLFGSRLFTIQSLELEFSNGQQALFERIKANAGRAVMVAAVTTEREIMLVREYAAGTERYELQLPKGIVEPGESSEDAANRELEAAFLAEMVRADMVERFGNQAYTAGFRVFTTTDSGLQKAANAAIRKALQEYEQ